MVNLNQQEDQLDQLNTEAGTCEDADICRGLNVKSTSSKPKSEQERTDTENFEWKGYRAAFYARSV